MPNLDPWINHSNRNEEESPTSSKFENHLLSIRDECLKMIRPKCHPTYNERHEKIIELIDRLTWNKYKAHIEKTKTTQQNEQPIIIDNIIEELDKKEICLYTKRKELN